LEESERRGKENRGKPRMMKRKTEEGMKGDIT